MNKKLLESTIKSILHYRKENDNMNEVITINESVIKEHLESLKQFSPYQVDDVIIQLSNQVIRKVTKVEDVRIDFNGKMSVKLYFVFPNRSGGWDGSDYEFHEVEKWETAFKKISIK